MTHPGKIWEGLDGKEGEDGKLGDNLHHGAVGFCPGAETAWHSSLPV